MLLTTTQCWLLHWITRREPARPVLSRCRGWYLSLSLMLLIRINERLWRLLLCRWRGGCPSKTVNKLDKGVERRWGGKAQTSGVRFLQQFLKLTPLLWLILWKFTSCPRWIPGLMIRVKRWVWFLSKAAFCSLGQIPSARSLDWSTP